MKELNVDQIPAQAGAFIPIEHAKEVMCKLCIRGHPKEKEVAEAFDYTWLQRLAKRSIQKILREEIEDLDGKYKRRRTALLSEFESRTGEAFTEKKQE